jgi:hypothetical protein
VTDYQFTEADLRSQDGKKVPLRAGPGGPVIGEATLKYDESEGALMAVFDIDDPKLKKLIGGDKALVAKKRRVDGAR